MARLFLFIALMVLIIWGWPYFFQKPAVDAPGTSVTAEFTDVERQYYRQVFDYAMETVAAGNTYPWKSANGSGTILVGAVFKSKSDSQCRSFNEQYITGGASGVNDGIACKREGRAGWCRLKKTDALTCALEPPGDIVERATQGTHDALEAGKEMLGKIKGWSR